MPQRVVDSAKMELTNIVSRKVPVARPLPNLQNEAVTND